MVMVSTFQVVPKAVGFILFKQLMDDDDILR